MMFMAMELGYETGIWNILGYGLFFFVAIANLLI